MKYIFTYLVYTNRYTTFSNTIQILYIFCEKNIASHQNYFPVSHTRNTFFHVKLFVNINTTFSYNNILNETHKGIWNRRHLEGHCIVLALCIWDTHTWYVNMYPRFLSVMIAARTFRHINPTNLYSGGILCCLYVFHTLLQGKRAKQYGRQGTAMPSGWIIQCVIKCGRHKRCARLRLNLYLTIRI